MWFCECEHAHDAWWDLLSIKTTGEVQNRAIDWARAGGIFTIALLPLRAIGW